MNDRGDSHFHRLYSSNNKLIKKKEIGHIDYIGNNITISHVSSTLMIVPFLRTLEDSSKYLMQSPDDIRRHFIFKSKDHYAWILFT